MFLEPFPLLKDGEYNLNVLKDISVTSEFLGMNQDDKACQNQEPQLNCTTRFYKDSLLEKCKCLPFNIRLSDEVR